MDIVNGVYQKRIDIRESERFIDIAHILHPFIVNTETLDFANVVLPAPNGSLIR